MSHLSEDQLDHLIAGERAQSASAAQRMANHRRESERGRTDSRIGIALWVAGQPWLQAAAAVLLLDWRNRDRPDDDRTADKLRSD